MVNLRIRLLHGALLALSLGGAWLSGQLLAQHAGIWGTTGTSTGLLARLCSAVAGPEIDCQGNSTSRWAELTIPVPEFTSGHSLSVRWGHIPVAFFGLAYFTALGAWFAFVGAPSWNGSRWLWFPGVLAAPGAAVSCIYLGIMALGKAPWCPSCVSVHVINFAMIALVIQIQRNPERGSLPAAHSRPKTAEVARALALALILIVGFGFYYRQHVIFGEKLGELRGYKRLVDTMRGDPDFLVREYLAQPRYAIPLRDGAGPSTQPRLVLFTDYECPACKCAARSAEKLIAESFAGGLDIDIRHYPLCSTCNRGVRQAFHPQACEAACAAEAARRLGGEAAFHRMSAQLFAQRTRLSAPLYPRLAAQIGLNTEHFVEEMNGPVVRKIVDDDIALAQTLGVTGTPAMFLEGRRITELCQTPVFWEAIARQTAGLRESVATTRQGSFASSGLE